MRIVYYTRPAFLDTALPLIRQLAKLAEVHVVLEIAPEGWRVGIFDVPLQPVSSGIVEAAPLLTRYLPDRLGVYWADTASFNLAVHTCRGAIHLRSWQTSHRVAKFISSIEPDLIHLDDVSLRLAWVVPELRKVPIVMGLHDPEIHSGQENWRTGLARRLTFGSVRRFILHNWAQRDSFARSYPAARGRVEVIPFGALDIFREWALEPQPADADTGRTVLFFGRLSPYKGLDVLLQAAPLVADRIPGVRFVVAGRPIPGYVIPRLPVLGNGGVIELREGYASNTELAHLFQRATVVVCPYTDATQSGVVLTAYAFGKPVVATTVGGLPDYVEAGRTGLLVPPRDPNALSSALVQILGDVALRQHLERGVAGVAETRLSWHDIAAQTVAVYRSVVDI